MMSVFGTQMYKMPRLLVRIICQVFEKKESYDSFLDVSSSNFVIIIFSWFSEQLDNNFHVIIIFTLIFVITNIMVMRWSTAKGKCIENPIE